MLIRRTAPKKYRKALSSLTDWCKKSRHLSLKSFFRILNAKLRGHYNYYGVFGNSKSLSAYYHEAIEVVFKNGSIGAVNAVARIGMDSRSS